MVIQILVLRKTNNVIIDVQKMPKYGVFKIYMEISVAVMYMRATRNFPGQGRFLGIGAL